MGECRAIEALRAGHPVTDEEFDRLFPEWARLPSKRHWTPIEVARRAAQLAAPRPGGRVLDVGSGIGKFCLVGAATTRGTFTGVEQRAHFVQAARTVARRCAVPRCRFILANMLELDWREYEAFYLFNPFAEHALEGASIDDSIKRSLRNYRRYVRHVEARLRMAPVGARVVTFHGFGGEVPPAWRALTSEWLSGGRLELWLKERALAGARELEQRSARRAPRPTS